MHSSVGGTPRHRPRIAIAMGDAGGIGPELIVRVLDDAETYDRCRPLVIGDPAVMRDALSMLGAGGEVGIVERASDGAYRAGGIDVLVPEGGTVETIRRGQTDPDAGRAAAACIAATARLGAAGEVDGVVLAPASKQAMRLAGVEHPDDMTLFAAEISHPEPLLVGVMGALWTACVTAHVPFREVPELITRERVLDTISQLAQARGAARPDPRLAVAALNPHAGEGGMLGSEEIDVIEPAIAQARSLGIDVLGPLPADTAFPTALGLGLDAIVCMYHDQANIARKLSGFRGQATLYLGFPVPVGTTAHGTAFDLAGQGVADTGSIAATLDAVLGLCGAAQSADAREGADARG